MCQEHCHAKGIVRSRLKVSLFTFLVTCLTLSLTGCSTETIWRESDSSDRWAALHRSIGEHPPDFVLWDIGPGTEVKGGDAEVLLLLASRSPLVPRADVVKSGGREESLNLPSGRWYIVNIDDSGASSAYLHGLWESDYCIRLSPTDARVAWDVVDKRKAELAWLAARNAAWKAKREQQNAKP
jgi:hypothetical protein